MIFNLKCILGRCLQLAAHPQCLGFTIIQCVRLTQYFIKSLLVQFNLFELGLGHQLASNIDHPPIVDCLPDRPVSLEVFLILPELIPTTL